MRFTEQSLCFNTIPEHINKFLSHPNTFHDNKEVEMPVREWLKMQDQITNTKKLVSGQI